MCDVYVCMYAKHLHECKNCQTLFDQAGAQNIVVGNDFLLVLTYI